MLGFMKKLMGILGTVLLVSVTGAGQKPNVLFFIIDDLGWMDLSCQGSTFYETPRLDSLAEEGTRFTQAYAAHAKCVASRMALFMGKYPARVGNPGRKSVMPPSEKTLAETFQENGYATFFAGKWHVGRKKGEFPEDQGFDVNKGGGSNGHPATYFYPYAVPDDPKKAAYAVHGLEGGKEGEYLTDRLTDEAIAFIQNRDKSKPFFVFVSYYAVHEPLEAKPEKIKKYKAKLKRMGLKKKNSFIQDGPFYFDAVQDNPVYAAMIESVDENIGRLLDVLKEEGLENNTIVIVTSDNGGKSHNVWKKNRENQPTSNLPLRAAKCLLYEGGIRVPLIVKWPGQGKRGQVCDDLVHGVDHYATLLEMVGLPLQPQQHLDSVSYVACLKGEKRSPRPPMFWNFPQTAKNKKYGYAHARAVRAGDYKLIEWWQLGKIELYNLRKDPGEHNDLSKNMPEKTAELRAILHKWVKDTGAPELSYGQ